MTAIVIDKHVGNCKTMSPSATKPLPEKSTKTSSPFQYTPMNQDQAVTAMETIMKLYTKTSYKEMEWITNKR